LAAGVVSLSLMCGRIGHSDGRTMQHAPSPCRQPWKARRLFSGGAATGAAQVHPRAG
jgi:hypothetical protein